MTTEAEAVHAANPDSAATRCGLPFTADLRLSPKRSRVTCPACLTAMGDAAETESRHCEDWCGRRGAGGVHRGNQGPRCYTENSGAPCRCSPECGETDARYWDTAIPEPRVISGLDTAAATPALDTRDGPYCMGCHQHVEKCDTDAECETCPGRAARATASAPDQSIPVETPPCDPRPACIFCGARWAPPEGVDATVSGCLNCEPRCFICWRGPLTVSGSPPACADCVSKMTPAAPAPGVGEGPRELTFAEALALDPAAVEVEDEQGHWHSLAAMLDCTLGSLRQCKFRLKPGPLPAPAPRVSRVTEMAEEWGRSLRVTGDVSEATVLAYRVVGAVVSFVRERHEKALAAAIEREFLEPHK